LALDECFDTVSGIFLDDGDSLFDTLATISAAEASIPVGDKCATLAAQVAHTARQLIADTDEWPSERHIGGAFGTIAHTAYHLGEIRQALCTLKP
jgi:adenylosuccinate lyase